MEYGKDKYHGAVVRAKPWELPSAPEAEPVSNSGATPGKKTRNPFGISVLRDALTHTVPYLSLLAHIPTHKRGL